MIGGLLLCDRLAPHIYQIQYIGVPTHYYIVWDCSLIGSSVVHTTTRYFRLSYLAYAFLFSEVHLLIISLLNRPPCDGVMVPRWLRLSNTLALLQEWIHQVSTGMKYYRPRLVYYKFGLGEMYYDWLRWLVELSNITTSGRGIRPTSRFTIWLVRQKFLS